MSNRMRPFGFLIVSTFTASMLVYVGCSCPKQGTARDEQPQPPHGASMPDRTTTEQTQRDEREVRIGKLFDQVTELRKERQYEKAAQVLREILATDPNHQRAQFMLEAIQDMKAIKDQRLGRRESRFDSMNSALGEAENAEVPDSSDGGGGMMGSMGGMGGGGANRRFTELGFVPQSQLSQAGRRISQGNRGRNEVLAAVREANSADEIWIISKFKGPHGELAKPAQPNDMPGCGELRAKLPKETKEVALPLKHTDVKASIAGYIATVDVTQQYANPYSEKIEAVYVFPLPENAAVNEFVMTVGDRKIRGIIRERAEAEKIYKEARSQGYVASLLTQERPNIFTQSVANIEPGKAIDINIRYFNTLAYMDGAYEFVFPMVVGPRFNPPTSGGVQPRRSVPPEQNAIGNGIGAVAQGSAGVSGQKTEVQYLKPGTRSGHDIAVNVDIDAGVKIEKIDCINHVVRHTWHGPERATVVLSDLDAIPNKDFVLRYKVAGDRVKSGLITHRDQRGGFFTLMVFPPAELASLKRAPVELVFVLDSSGSMNGQPIAQAKRAIERGLKLMQPDDTFQLINFSNHASQLGPAPLAASRANVQKGLDYLNALCGEGGTMMIEGIKAALDFPHDPKRLRFVVFCTDGYIGNEAEIFGEVHHRLRDSRIFSFGVGTSVNRYLLDGLARIGSGAVAYLSLNESAPPVMDTFFERISHPAMTDLVADWGGLQVTDVYPRKLHDLFVGRPMIITGRFKGTPAGTVRIKGKAGQHDAGIDIPLSGKPSEHAGLAAVWARMKIADLSARSAYDGWRTVAADGTVVDHFLDPRGVNELSGEIKNVALEYGLMSQFTSFVAVDSLSKTAGDHGTTVAVPVPAPDGVRYDTTVQE